MNTLKIHHIGYLVKKINAAVKEFEHLGFKLCQDIIYDDNRKIHICFMEKDGYWIELVSPADPSSVVSGLLKKYKNCPYHICYETKSFSSDLAKLEASGYLAIEPPAAAPAINGQRVIFLMHAMIGMIELLETDNR